MAVPNVPTVIMVPPSWSCSLYPVTVDDANIIVQKAPDYLPLQPRFDYIELQGRKQSTPCFARTMNVVLLTLQISYLNIKAYKKYKGFVANSHSSFNHYNVGLFF